MRTTCSSAICLGAAVVFLCGYLPDVVPASDTGDTDAKAGLASEDPAAASEPAAMHSGFHSTRTVGRRPDGTQVTPVNQFIDPAGKQIDLPGLRPQVVAISPDGSLLVTSGKTNEIVVCDPVTGAIIDRVKPPSDEQSQSPPDSAARNLKPDTRAIESYTGLKFSPDGSLLAMSNVHGSVKLFTVCDGRVHPSHSIRLPPANAPGRSADIPAGLAFSVDGSRLYVCGNLSNKLFEFDVSSGELLQFFKVGVAPFDVVLVGEKVFVTNRGGRRPRSGDLVGPAGRGTSVRVDPVRFTALEGSVSIVDLGNGEMREVLVGRHASAIAVSSDQRHIVCANTADDSLSVLDAISGDLLGTIWAKRTPAELFSAMPNGLAFGNRGEKLYVTNGAQNAVAVIRWNQKEPTESVLEGLLPVGWFPGAVACDAARQQLVVANIKGISGSPRQRGKTKGFNTHQYNGSLSVIPFPTAKELARTTVEVDRNMRLPLVLAAGLPPRQDVPLRAIPERIGEPSLIEHVVYIIKENRTFDQVLGDMEGCRAEPSLCIFGEEVTPNQHALARQFVLLDNTYCCGILSADGHNWSTSAVANDYLEKSFAGFPRSYPDGMEDTGNDALAWSSAGFIWDAVLAAGRTVRNYGEFMVPRVRWKDPARKGKPDFSACYAAWKAGPEKAEVIFASEPVLESLRPHSHLGTVGWNMSVPDQFRADVVIADLADFEKKGNYPNLTIICLPQDHTSGTAARCPTPAACMADNDLAVGRIVESLSQSSFWPKMAIFIIEDDPQAGWDHVSGYRTTAYVVSPYAKRGVTINTQYNSTSVLRTIGQILGTPPMNLFDASATPMFDCFHDVADLGPFEALPATIPLDQLNPPVATITDALLRAHAAASSLMDFSQVDKAPEELLNRVLWHAVRGSEVPFPVWAIAADDEDNE